MEEEKILNKILTEKIKPISKRYFLVKRYSVIGLGFFVTLMGAFVFAKIFATLIVSGWEYWDYVYDSFGSFLYVAMPFLWILLLVLFTFLMPFIIEKTAHGYRYKKIIFILLSILASVVLGIIILKLGSYSGLNKFFISDIEKREAILWVKPEQGRLAGRVTNRSTDSIILEDYRGKVWAVDVSNILPASKKITEENDQVRIVGLEVDENTFVACQVMNFDISSNLVLGDDIEPLKTKDFTPNSITSDICNSILKSGL